MDPEKEKVVAKPASAVEKKDEKKTQEAKTTAKKRPRSRSGDKDREAKKLASKRKSVEAAMESSSSSSSSGSDSSDSSDDEDCGRFVLGHCRPRPMPMPRLPSSATGIARKKPPRDRNARPNLKRSNFTTGPRVHLFFIRNHFYLTGIIVTETNRSRFGIRNNNIIYQVCKHFTFQKFKTDVEPGRADCPR